MTTSLSERVTSTPEGMALYQQERLILEVTELIYSVMLEQGIGKAALAARLGKSRAFVTQLLDGRANMTLRTISDVLGALGKSLNVSAGELSLTHRAAPGEGPAPRVVTYERRRTPRVIRFEIEPPPPSTRGDGSHAPKFSVAG